MGNQLNRNYICCSTREKLGVDDAIAKLPQFLSAEVEVKVEHPVHVAFAPLHQREAASGSTRRLAVGGLHEVHVYRVQDGDLVALGQPPALMHTHTVTLGPSFTVLAVLFADEDSSRHLVVSFQRTDGSSVAEHGVQVWNCEAFHNAAGGALEWHPGEGQVASLDEHRAPVNRLAANRTYFLTADTAGECRLWLKTRCAFTRRASVLLHKGGVADIVVDRLFAYSTGQEDRKICAWHLPELAQVLVIPTDVPDSLLSPGPPGSPTSPEGRSPGFRGAPVRPASPAAASSSGPSSRLVKVTMLRRPLSRWQGSTRGSKEPRGWLFAAGILREGQEAGHPGAGVLMEWSLGEKSVCRSLQIAHDTPIVALVYGPYDNGPLVSGDARGCFRVWESTLDRGLCLAQQIDMDCTDRPVMPMSVAGIGMAVEQPRGLYVAVGTKKLSVWQRYQDAWHS